MNKPTKKPPGKWLLYLGGAIVLIDGGMTLYASFLGQA